MTADLARLVAGQFLPDPPSSLGIAVSGGSDSMALLHLLVAFAKVHGITLHAATVDHGLRPEAGAEAAMVARICRGLGIGHHVLEWQGRDHKGNLQDEARKARYGLLAQWANDVGVEAVALGHTADDVAETFLMRVSRRAGVDGLAAMPASFERDGISWVRPLLRAHRSDLQTYLGAENIKWVDDPSNDDDRFERVRMRKALAILSGLGVDADAISDVALNLTDAKDALNHQMVHLARDIITLSLGTVAIDEAGLADQPDEMRRRLIVHALKWVNGAYYAPRSTAVAEVFAALAQGSAATLAGCELRRKAGKIFIFRELNAVSCLETPVFDSWDDRWRFIPPTKDNGDVRDLTLRALGPVGLKYCKDWRDLGIPRRAALSLPAVWQGTQLIAAPLAGWPQNWQAVLERGENTFFAAHITH
jgi:tRNA(Ile)-lysidine synthase